MKKITSLVLSIALCLSFNIVTYAQTETVSDGEFVIIPSVEDAEVGLNSEESTSTFSSGSYEYVGKKTYWGVVRYFDYLCYKHTSDWYVMTGLNLTMALSHTKNTGDKSLSCTISQTYSSETARNFSTGVGMEAGTNDMVKACVDLGYGVTKTKGKAYQISSTIGVTIPSYANTGYYKMHVCHNFYKMKIISQHTDGTNAATYYMGIPYGESYAAVLYSTSTASGTWSKW